MSDVHKKSNSSLTWRGICAVWEKFKKGVGRKIGNGCSISFWFDNWSELNVPLIDLIPGFEGLIHRNEKVVDYVSSSGEWDRLKLGGWFQPHIIDRIMCAHPPREERGEDKFIWIPSTDGCFSVSSAYHFSFAGTHHVEESLWKYLWRWPIPEKIKSFMWLFSHGRAHTAQLRFQRGIINSANCPFGCAQEEDSMHLLRDCINARRRWTSVVDPSAWTAFSTKQGADWVKWNLQQEAGQSFTKKIKWSILFGYICWDIWIARCNQVFGEASTTGHDNAHASLMRACWDQDLLTNCRFYKGDSVKTYDSSSNRDNVVRLEVDGSVLHNGSSGCGGVIWGNDNLWLTGFVCKLTTVPPTIAELIGILQGLNLCWNKGYKKVEVASDCIEALNLITRGCDVQHPYRDIIDEVRLMFCKDWQVLIIYVPREENNMADHLAKLSHNLVGNFCIMDQPPPFSQAVVAEEDV